MKRVHEQDAKPDSGSRRRQNSLGHAAVVCPRVGRLSVAAVRWAPRCWAVDPRAVEEQLPIAVQVVTVRPQTFATEMRYSATVKELQKVDLSFKVAGTVQELYQVTDPTSAQTRDVQVGDAVPSEAVLARLDDADYRRKWNAAQRTAGESREPAGGGRRGCRTGREGSEACRGAVGQRGGHAGESGRGRAAAHHGRCRGGRARSGTWRRPGSPNSRPRTIWTTAH